MLNYIIDQLKKVSKRRMAIVIAICLVGVCLLLNVAVMAFTLVYGSDRDGVLGSNVLAFATWCFPIPYIATIFIADLVFGPEYPNPLIKDKVTKNLKRWQIYLGKYITEVAVSFVYMVFAFICILVTTSIFHSDIKTYDINLFVENMLISVTLWMAGVSFGNMFLFGFRDKRKAYACHFALTLVIPRFIMFLAAEPISFKPFLFVRTILISQSFSHIPYPADPARNVPFIVIEGIVYVIISCAVGLIYYSKKNFNAEKYGEFTK